MVGGEIVGQGPRLAIASRPARRIHPAEPDKAHRGQRPPLHFFAPGERVDRQSQFVAGFRQPAAAVRHKHGLARPAKSVGRNYPRSAPSRPKAGDRRPGPTRPPLRSAGCGDIGCRSATRSGRRSAACREAKQRRQQQRNEPGADKSRDAPLCRRQGENAVGRGDQPPGKADPLQLVGVEQRSAAPPFSTAASFQARFTASPMPVFIPWPPTGLWTWAASPSRNARPCRKLCATR